MTSAQDNQYIKVAYFGMASLDLFQDGSSSRENMNNALSKNGASLVAQTVRNQPAIWETWV